MSACSRLRAGVPPAVTSPRGPLRPVEEGLHRAGRVTTGSSSKKERAGHVEMVPSPTREWRAQPWQSTGGWDKSEAPLVHGGQRSGRVTRKGDRVRPPNSTETCSRRRPGSVQEAAAEQQAFLRSCFSSTSPHWPCSPVPHVVATLTSPEPLTCQECSALGPVTAVPSALSSSRLIS